MNERDLLCRLLSRPSLASSLARDAGLSQASVQATLEGLQAAGIPLQLAPDGYWRVDAPLDLLDPVSILGGLDKAARAQLAGLELDWRVDSTNARLLAAGASSGPGIRVLLAEGQEQGRGRNGRRWVSPLCSHIYLSLDGPFPAGVASMGGLSIAVGVMVVRALVALGIAGVGLKWPNDLLTADGKLGGILIESAGAMRGPARAVIGIGLNVHAWPEWDAGPGIDQPCDWLDRLAGRRMGRSLISAALLDALLPGLALFREQGLAPFLGEYAEHDVLAGAAIWIDDGRGGRLPAIALGLAPDGSLRVREGGVERCIHAGEVSVRLK